MLRVWFSGISSTPRASGHTRSTRRLAACTHSGRNDGFRLLKPPGKQVGVDRRELEARVAQVHRRVERDLVLLPLRAQPALDLGHALEDAALEILQRAGERGGEVGNHGGSDSSPARCRSCREDGRREDARVARRIAAEDENYEDRRWVPVTRGGESSSARSLPAT